MQHARSSSRHTRCRGVSLVEVLAVFGVVGLLLSLLGAAIQSSRESARKLTCQTRLREMGIALSAFEQSYKHLPRLHGPRISFPGSGGLAQFSVHAQLLSYLDQSTVAAKVDLSRPNAPFTWNAAHKLEIPIFRCPSDANGKVSYRSCSGAAFDGGGGGNPEVDLSGVFHRGRERTLADIRDGTSHTVVFSERIAGNGSVTDFHAQRDYWFSGLDVALGNPIHPDVSADEMSATCAALSGPPSQFHPYAGYHWTEPDYSQTSYNHVAGPNSAISDCAYQSYGVNFSPDTRVHNLYGQFSARSEHAAIVNVLFADGHVKSIASVVDLQLWRAMATCAGNETVGVVE